MDAKQKAFYMSALALMGVYEVAKPLVAAKNAHQAAELEEKLADGYGEIALFVRLSAGQIRVALALVSKDEADPFEASLMRLNGPFEILARPTEDVETYDLASLN